MSEYKHFEQGMDIVAQHTAAVALGGLNAEQRLELDSVYAPRHENYTAAVREYLGIYGPDICGIK